MYGICDFVIMGNHRANVIQILIFSTLTVITPRLGFSEFDSSDSATLYNLYREVEDLRPIIEVISDNQVVISDSVDILYTLNNSFDNFRNSFFYKSYQRQQEIKNQLTDIYWWYSRGVSDSDWRGLGYYTITNNLILESLWAQAWKTSAGINRLTNRIERIIENGETNNYYLAEILKILQTNSTQAVSCLDTNLYALLISAPNSSFDYFLKLVREKKYDEIYHYYGLQFLNGNLHVPVLIDYEDNAYVSPNIPNAYWDSYFSFSQLIPDGIMADRSYVDLGKAHYLLYGTYPLQSIFSAFGSYTNDFRGLNNYPNLYTYDKNNISSIRDVSATTSFEHDTGISTNVDFDVPITNIVNNPIKGLIDNIAPPDTLENIFESHQTEIDDIITTMFLSEQYGDANFDLSFNLGGSDYDLELDFEPTSELQRVLEVFWEWWEILHKLVIVLYFLWRLTTLFEQVGK